MKYAILLALLVCAVFSQEESDESKEQPQIEEAGMFGMNPMYGMYPQQVNRMGYSAMTNQLMANPPQQAIEYYSQMTDEDFPVDYSLACSNNCGCRSYCVVMWFIPCNCMCPPQCPSPTEVPVGRFPTTEFPANRFPPRFTTTQAPRWPQPQPINPPSWNNNNRWPPANGWDPNNPNNFPTHPPTSRTPSTTPSPWRPPNWNNPNPWDPNNPNNFPTHPPATTTTERSIWWPQQPQQPQWPQQPQQPQWPQQPQQPQWPQPEPELPWWQQPQPQPDPNVPWWQQPQQPQQPVWPPQPEPIPEQNNPWWQPQQPQQPQPLPQPLPNWPSRPAPNPQVPEFPHWNQPPITDWAPNPPRQEDPCDDQCSCTPCTIIWICPVQCSTSCCASRRFGEAENVDKIEGQQEAQSNFSFEYPEYLKDIFVPGAL